MKTMFKRFSAFFIALVMLVGVCCPTALAGQIMAGENGQTIYLSWSYYTKDGSTYTPVTELQKDATYRARLSYAGNPTERQKSIQNFDLCCTFNAEKVSVESTDKVYAKIMSGSFEKNVVGNEVRLSFASTSGIYNPLDEEMTVIGAGSVVEVEFTTNETITIQELHNLFQVNPNYARMSMLDGDNQQFTIVEAPDFTASAKADATFYTSDTETDVAKKLSGTFIDASGTSTVVDVTSVTFKNALTAGENVVTASYEYEGVTYTCDVTINVTADTLTGIEVTTQPKLNYDSGEALDLSGMVVTATYASNKTKVLTKAEYTTSPEEGTVLKMADRGSAVTVTADGQTAATNALTVTPKSVTIPVAAGSYTYTGEKQRFSFAEGTDADSSYYTLSPAAEGQNAGTYTVTASLKDKTEISWADNTTDDIALTWTIDPKAITPTIADISDQQYTGEQIKPEITVTADGVTLTKNVDYTVSYGDNTKVGKDSGSVTINAAENGNYTFEPVTKQFNIVRQAGSISITAKPAEYTGTPYAESNIEVTKTGTGDVTYTYYLDAEANTPTTTEDTSGAASKGAAPKNAGTYYVKASMAASENYGSATSKAASFTITQKALTVTAKDESITFGDSAPDYTFTATGYVGDDNDSVVTANLTCGYEPGSDAGTYTITVTAAAANYEITCNSGTLTVAMKTLTANELTASETNPTAKEYDGTTALPGVTYQVTINGNAYPVDGTAEFDNKNVGTGKTVTFTPNAFNSTNYEFETGLMKTFMADITAKPLTVTGLTATDRVYDKTTNVTLTGGALTGVISGDAVSADMPTSGTVESADASEMPKDVTFGAITLTGTDAGNYTLTQPAVTVTISKATPELGTVSYTGSIYPTTLKETVTLTSEATVGGSLKLDGTGAFNTVGTAEYAYTFTPTDEVNYNAVHGTVSITVLKDTLKELVVDSTNVKTTYTYPQAFDTTGLTVTAKYESGNRAAVNVDDLTCSVTGPIPYGTDKVTFSYTVDDVTKSFDIAITVFKGKVDLSGYQWPTATTFTYDSNEHSIELTGSNEQVASISYTDNKATYVGTYTAAADFTLKDAANYEIDATTKPGTATLTISPAKRELTSTATETNPAMLTKDGRTLDLANLVTTNAGEKSELTFTCTNLYDCELSGSILKSGATYDVTLAITVSAGAVYVNDDSTPEYTAADDLTIYVTIVNKQDAGLQVTGISETMTYGDEMEWSYNVEHPSEDGRISCAVSPQTGVLENDLHVLKAIGVGTATVTITYDSAEYHAEQTFTITVQPKAVTVKADDKSRAFGEANPELTWSLQDGSSLVGQDTLNLNISTTANAASVPDSYPITLTEVEGANPNYAVTTQNGTLKVTKKTLSGSDVTIDAIPDQTYTGQEIEPEVTVNGYSSTTDYDVTYADNIRVGIATATVHFKGNYTGTASKTFRITPKALTVSGVAASNKIYDGTTTATITATLQGVADGDSVQLTAPAADFDTKDAGTGKAVTIAAGGSFTISGADAGNYTLTQPTVSGLTADITPATLTAPGNQTVTIRNNVTTKQTVSLPAVSGVGADGTLIPVSVTVSENSAACFAVAPTYEAGVITYQLVGGLDAAHVSETQTVTVTLGFGGNYNTVSYQLTISITDRQPQAELTYTGATVMTYGETLTLRSAGGSGSGAVSYTVREDTGKAEISSDQLKATQAGTVYVTVHKAADADYTEASSSEVAITIRKAVPTGTPAYTKITSAGKTLADANLTTVGGTFSVPGSVAWELPDTTTVVANRAYTWIFTPDDTTNYESISGEIVLYNFVDTPYFPAIIGDSSKFNFHDVTRFDYFYDAVKWAVDHDITSGTGRFTFSPNAACTRAQTVTFLWRAAGSPRPVSTVNPFTDVHYGDYFYQAVLWAVENGITMGTSATTFSPDATVTRAQVVTFLWRANGQPAAWNSGFTDVSADAYYAKAVAWAVQNGITTGTGFGVFSADAACTRAQIVTFLYRNRK